MDEGNAVTQASNNPMSDIRPTGLVGGGTAVNKPSYLEQFAQELGRYRELLNILDNTLGVVSDRKPSEQNDNVAKEPRVHISTMVHILHDNNRTLDRIIGEIAL